MKQQKGFTLIELVMVIVILGVLAAFALPRFADLGGDARASSMKGLAGAINSAAGIARSEQLVSSASLGTSVTLDGQDVTMVNGYPTADSAGIIAATGIASTDYTSTGGGTAGGTDITFVPSGFTGANCQVVYSAAEGAGTPSVDNTAPISSAASAVATVSGC